MVAGAALANVARVRLELRPSAVGPSWATGSQKRKREKDCDHRYQPARSESDFLLCVNATSHHGRTVADTRTSAPWHKRTRGGSDSLKADALTAWLGEGFKAGNSINSSVVYAASHED